MKLNNFVTVYYTAENCGLVSPEKAFELSSNNMSARRRRRRVELRTEVDRYCSAVVVYSC